MPSFLKKSIIPLILLPFLVTACESIEYSDPKTNPRHDRKAAKEEMASVLGGDGVSIFGGDDDTVRGGTVGGFGVNSHLWRAALDVVSFMPLASADPFGGVIVTDWYSPEGQEEQRFKVNVYVLSPDLRSDGLRVALFKQRRGRGDSWVDVDMDKETQIKFENAILQRAREIRIDSLKAQK